MATSGSSVDLSASRAVGMFSNAMRQLKEGSTIKLVTKRNVRVLQDIAALQMYMQEKAVLDVVEKMITDLRGSFGLG